MPAAQCEITGRILSIQRENIAAEFGSEHPVTIVSLRIETRRLFRLQDTSYQNGPAAGKGCAPIDKPVEIKVQTCRPLADHWADTPVWGVLNNSCLDGIISMTGAIDTAP